MILYIILCSLMLIYLLRFSYREYIDEGLSEMELFITIISIFVVYLVLVYIGLVINQV